MKRLSRSLFSAAWHRLRHGCPLPGSASLANSCFLLAAIRAEGWELLGAAGCWQG